MIHDFSLVPCKVKITAKEELGIELPIIPFGKVILNKGESIELIANTSSELVALTLLEINGSIDVLADESSEGEKVTVSDSESLSEAFNNPNVKEITLDSDISFDKELDCQNSVTFDGKGHTMTFSNTGRNLVFLKSSTIKNVKINNVPTKKSKSSSPEVWSSNYGMQLFNGTYDVENFSCTGCNAALLCNSADVTLSGNVDVSGNGFGGIEVSKSSGETQVSPVLRVKGEITNSTEKYSKPTIWIDGEVGEVEASGFTEANVKNQRQFYLNPENAKSNDATLKSLSLSDGTLSPEFSPSVKEYTATFASGTQTTNVVAEANDSKAKVTGTGDSQSISDQSKITVSVTAEDEKTVNDYVITVSIPTA